MSASTQKQRLPALMAAVMAGVLSVSFSAIFVNVALSSMTTSLHIPHIVAHWLVSGFAASSTLCMLLASWAARVFGVRTPFLLSLLIFIGISALGGSVDQPGIIIASRMIQGAATGFISVLALLALFEAYPIEQRGRAGANFGLGVALAPMLGPALSGFLVELWGWRAVFLAPIPLAFLSLLLCWRILPRLKNTAPANFDWVGFFLIASALAILMGGLSYLQRNHWPLPMLLGSIAALSVVTTALWKYERQRTQPLLNLRLFRFSSFSAACCVAFVYGMGLWGSGYILPTYLQEVVGYSAAKTGLVMLPSGLCLCLMLPFGGRLIDRYAAHRVVTVGLLCFASSFVLLSLNSAAIGFAMLALLIAFSRGFGLGLMIPGLDATASRALPSHDMGDGVAMVNFLRQLGGALSPSLLVLVLEWRTAANSNAALDSGAIAPSLAATSSAYHQTLLAIALLYFAAIVPAWRMRVAVKPALQPAAEPT